MKKYKFLLFILLLGFVFVPKDVFAVGESNTVTTTTQEFYWHGINAGGVEETQRFNSTQNHFYKWGTSTANYQLIRFAPLIHFNSFGVDTSYKARVAFYVITKYPFNYGNKFCTAWSGNGEKYSCSLYNEFEDQTGSNEFMLTFIYDYEWTSSTNYIEFWLNFDNFTTRPNDTEFGYTIIDFQGNVSGNQIILDGLGQTNEKLDEVKDIINNNFNKCYKNELKPFDFADTSQNGISIKNNGNGTFTLNGTATSYTAFYMQQLSLTPNIYYTLSGGYNDNGIIQIIDYANNPSTLSNGSVTFFNTQSTGLLYIVVFQGTTLNNVIFKPMLVKGEEQLSFVAPGKENCINRMDETNQKLDSLNKQNEEAEKTRKGIWQTLKDLPNSLKNMFLSLFVPDENYFEDKFDELLGNVEDVLGFLAYPFTLITRTFEFFLIIEDTGNYVISWEDVKVPNFEEFSIIKAGSFDFATLLEDSRIASLRNIAFVFINALLLLAFLQLCHNKYNEVFGGDVSTTEFISVAEEYDIDYKTGEVSNIKHIEKKTTRRDIK